MPADYENQVMPAHLRVAKDVGESARVDWFTRRVQQNLASGRVFGPEVGAFRFDLRHGRRGVTVRPFDVFGGQSVGVDVFRLAGVVKKDLHPANYSSAGIITVVPCRQSRSRS